jgi:hypothetical protein
MMILERDFSPPSETFCDVRTYSRFWHEEGLRDLLMCDTNDTCGLEDPISAPLTASSWSPPYRRDGIIPFSRKIVLSNPAYVPEVHGVLPASEHTSMVQAHVQTFGRRRPHLMRQLSTRSTWECSECIKAHHTEDVDRIHIQGFGRPLAAEVQQCPTWCPGRDFRQIKPYNIGKVHEPNEASDITRDVPDTRNCRACINYDFMHGHGCDISWL